MRWLSAQFLFYPYPGPLSGLSAWVLPALFGLLTLGSFALWAASRRAPDRAGSAWWSLAGGWAMGLGLPGLALTFFAWQRVPILSMRVLLAVNLLAVPAAGGWLAWRWFKQLPARRQALQRRREYRRYLPS